MTFDPLSQEGRGCLSTESYTHLYNFISTRDHKQALVVLVVVVISIVVVVAVVVIVIVIIIITIIIICVSFRQNYIS